MYMQNISFFQFNYLYIIMRAFLIDEIIIGGEKLKRQIHICIKFKKVIINIAKKY